MRSRSARTLRARLLPLHVGVALQGFMLWLPIEKLFMSEIGFDAAAVGVMAAAYAAVVPIVEVPSGILADRWSRKGVLALASLSLAVSSLVGGLSPDVTTYIAASLALGVYFAMFSGTLDSIVYDTVLEETRGSNRFEQQLGRVRVIEAILLVVSSLAGGWLAELLSTRATYLLTVPFAILSIIAYAAFREPRLHKAEAPVPLRRHLADTYRTLSRSRALLPIVALAVVSAMLLQTVFEFGPLWLVALSLAAVGYGPYWAALVGTLGVGGLLAGRIALDRSVVVGGMAATMAVAAIVLTTSAGAPLVIAAQVVLALLLVVAGIRVTHLLHDAVPSAVRAGVASGVGALSWIAFLPFALVFGLVGDAHGVATAGWMIVIGTLLAGLLWLRTTTGGTS